ncbi:cysteine hydrolase family protein [Nocardioides sp. CPCC 205120]|uniref:cysteine hydrolase family protein n=1 Tax=Nocardioides sp. CPCC 205120 TaxID=3406462 RepID=UPI003B502FEF
MDAVLMIDMQQGYFSDPDLEEQRPALVDACSRLVRGALDAGALVVEVVTVHEHDRSTWARNMLEDDKPFLLRGSEEAARLPGLPEVGPPNGVVLEKTRDSAFHRTDLVDLLHERGIDRLLLCGISTESCIGATALDAYSHDFETVLVADAIASPSQDSHVRTLDHLGRSYRQPGVGVADVLPTLTGA